MQNINIRQKKNKNVSGNMPAKKWVDRSFLGHFLFFFFFLGKPYHVKYLNIDIQFNQKLTVFSSSAHAQLLS